MNPWSGKGEPIAVPTKLTKHAADVDAEAENAQAGTAAENVASEAAPAR